MSLTTPASVRNCGRHYTKYREPSPRAGCVNAPVRFDERVWKRSMVWLVRHRQTKGPATDRSNLTQGATSRLYTSLPPRTENQRARR
jgi:hypothetical protein